MSSKRTYMLAAATIVAMTVGITVVNVISDDEPQRLSGIVTLACDTEARLYTVDIHDPATGKVTASRYFKLGTGMESTANCSSSIPGQGLRSAFSEDFNYLAVRKQMSRNGFHAGVVAAADSPNKVGKFTDLSGDTDGFGAYAKQSKPAFGPDGKLYFVQPTKEGTTYLQTVEVGEGNKPEPVNGEPQVDNPNVGGPLYYLPGAKAPQTDDTPFAAYLNDGSWGFSTEADNDKIIFGALNGDKTYTVPLPHGKGAEADYTIRMDPRVALNKKDFLGLSPTWDRLYTVHVDREQASLTGSLTVTNGSIVDPQLSPDGKSIVYISATNSHKYALQRATLEGTNLGQPQKLPQHELPATRDVRLLTVQ